MYRFQTDVGVYISRVEEGSIAESVGLKPGDSILEVNGRPFSSISHEEALKVSIDNEPSDDYCKRWSPGANSGAGRVFRRSNTPKHREKILKINLIVISKVPIGDKMNNQH